MIRPTIFFPNQRKLNHKATQPTQPEALQSAMKNFPPQRYPRRNRNPPGHLKDYYVADDNEQQDFWFLLNTLRPPSIHLRLLTTKQSVELIQQIGSDSKRAMGEYIESLERNEIFTVTELQPDKTVIGGKWVY